MISSQISCCLWIVRQKCQSTEQMNWSRRLVDWFTTRVLDPWGSNRTPYTSHLHLISGDRCCKYMLFVRCGLSDRSFLRITSCSGNWTSLASLSARFHLRKKSQRSYFAALCLIGAGTSWVLWIIASISVNLCTTSGSKKMGLDFTVSLFAVYRRFESLRVPNRVDELVGVAFAFVASNDLLRSGSGSIWRWIEIRKHRHVQLGERTKWKFLSCIPVWN